MVNFNQSPNPHLDSVEKIYKLAESSEFQDDKLEACKEEIIQLAAFLKADQQQAVILAVLLWLHLNGDTTSVKEVLDHIRLKRSAAIYINKLLKPFVDRDLLKPQKDIRYHPFGEYNFNSKMLHCLVENDWKYMVKQPCFSSFDVLKEFGRNIRDRRAQDISYIKLAERTACLIGDNKELPLCKFLNDSNYDPSTNIIFLTICYNHLSGSENFTVESLLNDIKPSLEDQFKIRQDFKAKKGVLFKAELIEPVKETTLSFSDDELKLSEQGVRTFIPDYSTPQENQNSDFLDLVEPGTIQERTMFYNKKEEYQINRLQSVLMPDKYAALSARLKKKGKRVCITAIFYGAPGTGKTETALQLAKATGRMILAADVSAIRSKWVGETEKHTKKLFSDYRKIRSQADMCPILLFNEADSILSTRRQVTDKVDQMENAMQNILLQELETFEGIFIATTNLEKNIDPAYDRRITFKVKYGVPTEKARLAIWKQKLPDVSETLLSEVNRKYVLTGGQIENINQKIEVDMLLGDESSIDLAYLCNLSEEESALRASNERNTLGFQISLC